MKIEQAFKQSPLFIPFIMTGYPNRDITLEAACTLIESGCDILELGIPFSDPIADGAVNQRAAEIALKQGIVLTDVFELVSQIRMRGYKIPIVLFSYLNPILAMGLEQFVIQAKAVGVNGVLIVDLPPEEDEAIYVYLRQYLEIVLLTSPTTNPERFKFYKKLQPAFIYHISRCGVTGIQSTLGETLAQEVLKIRKCFPVGQRIAVGFGISTPAQAKEVAGFADGVIIGSKLIQTLEQKGLGAFKELIRELRDNIK